MGVGVQEMGTLRKRSLVWDLQRIPAAIRLSLEASGIKVPAFNLPYCGAL